MLLEISNPAPSARKLHGAGLRPRYFSGYTWLGMEPWCLMGDQLQLVIIPVSQISTLGPSKVKGGGEL